MREWRMRSSQMGSECHWRLLLEDALTSGMIDAQHLTISSDEVMTVDLHLALTIWTGTTLVAHTAPAHADSARSRRPPLTSART